MDEMERQQPSTTSDAGIPAASDEFSLTVGPGQPTVLQDAYVVRRIQHFNREWVPERVVHAKGSGAHGFFEVTEDVTQWTRASCLSEVGTRTPMFARFSQVAREARLRGHGPRRARVRAEGQHRRGNYDLVGNNTPALFIRDASKYQDFIHSQKRMPNTELHSNDTHWDCWTLSHESAHQVTVLMSDRCTLRAYRNTAWQSRIHPRSTRMGTAARTS